MMKKNFVRVAALVMVAAMVMCFAGCKPSKPAEAGDRTVIQFYAANVSVEMKAPYENLVKTYNETQGLTDGVYVQLTPNSGALANLESSLRSSYMYDVIQINDNSFKHMAIQGNFFVPLDEYLTEDVKTAMQWDDIPENLINRFRLNTTQDSASKKYLAGAGASLLALPNGSDPQVLFYNKAAMEKATINVISVPEAELEAYNSSNGASLMPHGYAEYKEAPFADAKSSRNEAGQTVYKVFNECIAMSWEENRCLARAFQQQYDYEYGYMSEWWFNYGFSVGGDCIGWDETAGQYKFTLMDKQAGYLALADIQVNGSSYKAGEVLRYEDKSFLNQNAAELAKLEGKVYPIASQYDAFLEFNRYGVPANKVVEGDINGYGLAPNTTQNRSAGFLNGTCPLYIDDFSNIQSFQNSLKDSLGMAMPAQYRVYEGDSTYTVDGKEYLKVIGETYDGQVYTGQLKQVGGVDIVGEAATESGANGYFIPANTVNKNYEQAFKFAAWAAGPEGQKILAAGNMLVPNQTSYGLGEYAESADRILPNMWAGAYLAQQADIGDYAYFDTRTWIDDWSQDLNKKVRAGDMTLTAFMEARQKRADESLQSMRIRILGR